MVKQIKKYLSPALRIVGADLEPLMFINSSGKTESGNPEGLEEIDDFEW